MVLMGIGFGLFDSAEDPIKVACGDVGVAVLTDT